MSKLESIKSIYSAYLDKKLEENKKATVFSRIGKLLETPRMDGRLDSFYGEVKKLVEEMVQEGPDSQEAYEVADFILGASRLYKNSPIPEIIMVAAEGSVMDLIPYIEKEDAGILCEKYYAKVPKHVTYPNQKLLYEALKKKAGI